MILVEKLIQLYKKSPFTNLHFTNSKCEITEHYIINLQISRLKKRLLPECLTPTYDNAAYIITKINWNANKSSLVKLLCWKTGPLFCRSSCQKIYSASSLCWGSLNQLVGISSLSSARSVKMPLSIKHLFVPVTSRRQKPSLLRSK